VTPPCRALSGLAASVLLVSTAPTAVLAQDFEHVAPKLPSSIQPPPVEAPVEVAPASQDQTVLIPELKGVVFVGEPGALQPAGLGETSAPGGVSAPGLPLLQDPEFLARVRTRVGRPLTRADLDALIGLTRDWYRSAGHPFMEVTAPPQNVQSGVMQIVVTEYRLDQVEISGARHFSDATILRMGGLKSGDLLTLPRLREALDDYNRNPFMSVSAVAKPGGTTGLTDIALKVEDRTPFRVYAGYDNQGAPSLGRDEWYAGFNIGNLFGQAQVLSYQYTRSFSGRYESHSLSDVIPINSDARLWLFGAYATQRPEIGNGTIFASEGQTSQVSVRLIRDLPCASALTQSLQLGFDYKRTDNDLEFLGFTVLDSSVEIIQIPLVYTLAAPDRHGQTVLENTTVISPGGFSDHNTDAALGQLVPFADANYAYNRLSVTRTTLLPRDMTWVVRGMGQIASGNLPYSEQVGGGGLGGVRGYDPNVALGSQGAVFSTEVRTRAFGILPRLDDQMQLGLFLDYAWLSQPDPFPDLPESATLASVGFNIHYNIDRRFDIQMEVGSQLRRAPGANKHDTQIAVVATFSF
jgi:hemolysin activation/secretion protein